MDTNVLDWLENTAKRQPDKWAFSDSNNSLSFSQVLTYAKRIGSKLCKATNSKRPVAVISGRHSLTPVAFLGVVYSGCFYAPLDGSMPLARLNTMVKNLEAELLIVDEKHLELANKLDFSGKVLVLEELINSDIDEEILSLRRGYSNEEDPLYVIFTSGSTGVPKGVITSHKSLMCYIDAYSEVMGIDETDILGNQSPLDYIAAIRDIYLPLKHGASTVIIPKELYMTPGKLFDFLNENKISAVGWSVSALTLPVSLGAFDHVAPKYLKKVCFSGSVMPCSCLKIWQENLPDTKFVNQYGPTEATASCTYYVVDGLVKEEDVLPIGRPYKHYRVFLLSEDNRETPQGEIGEICVSGPTLALGYYNNRELTGASFMQNPLNQSYHERIYKTGDLGLMRADGNLEFHGRKDRQIKHLGHRVELGEIELAAGKIPETGEVCVIYSKEKENLYLFYTGPVDKRKLALGLREMLPGFMVPRKLMPIDSMPQLSNGKIDMQALRKYIN